MQTCLRTQQVTQAGRKEPVRAIKRAFGRPLHRSVGGCRSRAFSCDLKTRVDWGTTPGKGGPDSCYYQVLLWEPRRGNVNTTLVLLLLKVAIAPPFVGVVSLIALRYGHRAAGWLVALPINTGTIVFVLTLTEGTGFAATVALGALLGIVSVSAFALAYVRSALRHRWPACLGFAVLGFVVSTIVLSQAPELVLADLAAAVLAVTVVLLLVPAPGDPTLPTQPPRWEIPARMLTAALLVLAITTGAATLGARLSGLLSPIPVFTITLVIFTHSRHGPAPVFVFLKGLQYGLYSFAAFCLVVGVLLVPYGLAIAFGAGLAAVLGVYGVVRKVLDRQAARSQDPPAVTPATPRN